MHATTSPPRAPAAPMATVAAIVVVAVLAAVVTIVSPASEPVAALARVETAGVAEHAARIREDDLNSRHVRPI